MRQGERTFVREGRRGREGEDGGGSGREFEMEITWSGGKVSPVKRGKRRTEIFFDTCDE
jgi:hypothetical protein